MLRFSVDRTVLRRGFDRLTPAVLLEERTGRFATERNSDLAKETAWGIDRKTGDRGVLGFNFFNLNIKDKIEIAGTGRTTARQSPQSTKPAASPSRPFAGWVGLRIISKNR
jgi:hypothetical protein